MASAKKRERTALVLSAGGMFGAWQAGVWKALAARLQPDLVVGISVGALNGWAIAGGCPPEQLIERWMDPRTAGLMRFRLPRNPVHGIFDPGPLREMTRELCSTYTPAVPFATLLTELPGLKSRLVRESEIRWDHLAAACSVTGGFPPVRLDGKLYQDGGLLGAMPLWPALEMGATRVIGLNALPSMPSRSIRLFIAALRLLAPRRPAAEDPSLLLISPSAPLGRVRDAIQWRAENIHRWIALGEKDAARGFHYNDSLWRCIESTG